MTALLDMTNHWHFNIDRGVVSGSVIFLALKKDFDIVDHDLYDLGCRDGTVVRALGFHQCGPGSIPGLGVICGLSLLVLYSAPRGFLRVLRFPLSSKTDI